MTNEEIFAAWSPENSPWSTWVKPVLFAHAGSAIPDPARIFAPDVSWASPPAEKVALVLDLPGDEGVHAAVALAARGYCAVPVYNSLPLPTGSLFLDPMSQRPIAAVDVMPIVAALVYGAPQLAGMSISPEAPPAFLLDSNRHGKNLRMLAGEFDNRSVCFTTDFPSANFLMTHGICRVLLVQRERAIPHADLAHVLHRWQDGGLSLELLRIEMPMIRQALQISRPTWYGAMFQRALAAFGLHRARGGGFGAWMPDSTAGG